MTEEEKVLRRLIKAWESLPGGTHYSAQRVAAWLADEMAPAINAARELLIKNDTTRND